MSSILKRLQRMFLKGIPETQTSEQTSPPPYDSSITTTPSQKIKATDTPQWLWSRSQCRAWLTALCTELLDMESENAQKIAGRFGGYGPTIYLMLMQEWRDLLGNASAGDSVYAMLLGVRNQKGAVPKTVILRHGNEDTSKNMLE